MTPEKMRKVFRGAGSAPAAGKITKVKWDIILTLLLVGIFLSTMALAANDPGHDTLYIEETGNSLLTGNLNISDELRVGNLFYSDWLDILGNGSDASASRAAIYAKTGNSLYLNAPGNMHLQGGSIVYIDGMDLNVSQNIYATGTITSGGTLVCLANGTNCIGGTNTGNVSSITENGATPLTFSSSTGDVQIGISAASSGVDGYLTGSNWTTFNNKAGTGTCSPGQAVQNTTTSGVQCITVGSGTLTGSGANTRVAHWDGTSSLTSTSGFTFDGTDLTLPGDLNMPAAFYIGNGASAAGTSATAIGEGATATSDYSTALGWYATVNTASSSALALGPSASTNGSYSMALGGGAVANGESALAIGYANAGESYTIAIGDTAAATHLNSVALGRNATTTATNQFMIGDAAVQLDTTIHGDLNITGTIYTGGNQVCDESGNCGSSSGNISGTSGSNGRVAYWSSDSAITGTAGFTFDGTDLTLPGNLNTTGTIYTGGNQVCDESGNCGYGSGNISGSGTQYRVPIFTGAGTIGDSIIYANNTHVGIGTTAPATYLDIKGSGAAPLLNINGTTAGKTGLRLQISGATIGGLASSGLWEGDTTTNMSIYAETGKGINFYSGGSATEKMVIDPSGNVGIGTTAPSEKLTVNGNLSATTFYGAGTGLTGTAASLSIGGNAATASDIDGLSATGLVKRTGANTYTAITDSSTNWDTAYTHSQATTNVHGLTFTAEGSGGGLDADTIDTLDSTAFIRDASAGDWEIYSATNSSGYSAAALEVREYAAGLAMSGSASEAPRISFHWGGRVASQIGMDTAGIIRTYDNPGTGYETFAAEQYYVGATQIIDTSRNIVNAGTGAFSGALSSATLNTGQGANELYDMDQNVLTSSSPTFAGLYTTGPIYRNAAGTGYLNGRYSTYETTATSGAIYSIGGSYVPGTTTLGNMYGIGYGYSGNAGITATNAPASKWGMYVASGGTSRIFMNSDDGHIYINGAYYGAGTGLTGTAASLSIGGNAATATNAGTLDSIDSLSFLRSDAADSFTGTLTMSVQDALVASNYGHGVYGLYSPTRYQHVWSMGAAYDLPADGYDETGAAGNLYGLAWSYNPDYSYAGSNPQAKAGLNHQLLLMMNGITYTALGNGVWTSGHIQAPTGYIKAGTNTAGYATGAGAIFATSHIETDGSFYGSGVDLAEKIKASEADIMPGTVVELDPSNPDHVRRSTSSYSKLVAGIVSTNPGIVLGKDEGGNQSIELAVTGRVPVKVNDENGPIAVGDLLTTSSTPGEAMRCDDQVKCFGAILGKAMEPLNTKSNSITALVVLG